MEAQKKKIKKRATKTTKKSALPVDKNYQRVVVDEIFDNDTVRLLRAPRLKAYVHSPNFGIETWGDEKEDFISKWRVESFVGFPTERKLQEGDVFFIRYAQRLNNNYKPIKRADARKRHLLSKDWDWEKSKEHARMEIKEMFGHLSAKKMAGDKKSLLKTLNQSVRKKISSERKVRGE